MSQSEEGRAAARRAEITRQVYASGACEAFQSAMGQEHCQRCGRNEYLHWLRELLAECDRRSRAMEALVVKWRAEAERHKKHGDCYRRGQGWGLLDCAEELLRALASPAPAAEDAE
jgi:hypothetical protein